MQFGPYTVDLISLELYGSEGKIPLQSLPFQILTILVEQPGEWITREELRQRLWPADTFVDFDHSINTAIVKLRRALGDDADEPRYIETLPRHGYRLIVAVNETQPHKVSEAQTKLWKLVVPAAVLLAAILITGWLLYPWRRANALTEKDTIVLADIDNKTGDEVFDDALKQALDVELEQSPFLNVLSDQKVSETLRMMGKPTDAHITRDVGREVCQRAGSKALLTGTISRLGSHYLIGLSAMACSTGDTLAKVQGEAATKEDVLKTVSQATSSLRAKLGESLASVEKFDVPIEATTTSLEALKYFEIGLTIRRKEGDAAGVPFLRRAIELDPEFASAYSELGLSYQNLQQSSRALDCARKAYQLRNRATRIEQLSITAIYFSATGELDKEIQTYEMWAASYARNPVAHVDLGADYAMMGLHEKALPELQEGLRLAPDNVNVYTSLGAVYLYLNRMDDAKSTFDLALAHRLDDGGLRQFIYLLAFLRNDSARMEEQVAWAEGKPGNEDLLLSMQSDTEAYYGRMSNARELSRRAEESARHADSKETAALWQANAATREAELGNSLLARQGVRTALALSSGRDVKVQAALALARIGDVAQARVLVEELEKSYPTNTLLKFYWLPCIKAAIEINRGNGLSALGLLEVAAPYELAGNMPLYPAYLRGEAYLLLKNGTGAAAEFQKLVVHKGIVQNFITGSLVLLQNGRAYELAGDSAQAKTAYQEFFTLWKDADPNIPILMKAQSEFAKLQNLHAKQ